MTVYLIKTSIIEIEPEEFILHMLPLIYKYQRELQEQIQIQPRPVTRMAILVCHNFNKVKQAKGNLKYFKRRNIIIIRTKQLNYFTNFISYRHLNDKLSKILG